ncbi:MAG: elongation factor Ts [Deltaproteobacteria bacterium]|nr:elongation factor Ts [Deltaproteobacteria bacterium]
MSGISAGQVKELRTRTGAGIMDCKKALAETNGDLEAAIDFLRKKGLSAAAKKAGRVASEGLVVAALTDDGSAGCLLEVNSETDFVAKNQEFQSFCNQVAQVILDSAPADLAALLAEKMEDGRSVDENLKERIATIGENMAVRRFTRYSGEGVRVASYIHMGGKIGVLLEVACPTAEMAGKEEFQERLKDLTMHIAAARPLYLGRKDVAADLLEREKTVYREQAVESGKPEKIIEKIVSGRIEKYFGEICLLEQAFVKDGDIKISKLMEESQKKIGEGFEIRRFVRYELGEGIEKKQENFAAEIQAQLQGE